MLACAPDGHPHSLGKASPPASGCHAWTRCGHTVGEDFKSGSDRGMQKLSEGTINIDPYNSFISAVLL